MAGPDPAGAGERRARRAAILAWAAFSVVVWNVVFDAIIIQAGRDYLTRQALHQQGLGPAVTIRQAMDPALTRAARVATASGVAVGGVGAIAIWGAARRRPRRSPALGE
jgi:hypothetical protein